MCIWGVEQRLTDRSKCYVVIGCYNAGAIDKIITMVQMGGSGQLAVLIKIKGYLFVTYVIVIVHYIRIYGSKPPRTRAKPRGQGWFTLP